MAAIVICAPVRAEDKQVTTIRGQVLNAVTKEPVAHALVTVMGEQYAMFTDDQGRYEFQVQSDVRMGLIAGSIGTTSVNGRSTAFVNRMVNARKPGYLDTRRTASSVTRSRSTSETQPDMTIYLVPEALIVGHVDVGGSEGEVRIDCELYRKEMRSGRQVWSPSGSSTTWGNGECRFSELREGTYKLITHEQMDRDSLAQVPGAPLYGYPPVYYPNTTDFSAAGEIVVKPGQTAQVNLTVARHEYYPVRLATRNAPVTREIDISVWPMGHWGPGWSLGYNPAEQAIEGMLPDGNYTVEANSAREPGSTGITNFSVKGRPVEGPGLMFVPYASISATVHQEFQSGQDSGQAADQHVFSPHANAKRTTLLIINLSSLDDSSASPDVQARPVDESQGNEYTISSARPGRYRVEVTALRGDAYVSAIESGGKDLLHEPLVVPLGGSVPPIEITLRNDGAEVDGTVADSSGDNASASESQPQPPRFVYLVPMNEGQPRNTMSLQEGNFSFPQVPPGDYLLLASAEQQEDLENANGLRAQELQDRGQVIHLEAGQKLNVTLHLMDAGAE